MQEGPSEEATLNPGRSLLTSLFVFSPGLPLTEGWGSATSSRKPSLVGETQWLDLSLGEGHEPHRKERSQSHGGLALPPPRLSSHTQALSLLTWRIVPMSQT